MRRNSPSTQIATIIGIMLLLVVSFGSRAIAVPTATSDDLSGPPVLGAQLTSPTPNAALQPDGTPDPELPNTLPIQPNTMQPLQAPAPQQFVIHFAPGMERSQRQNFIHSVGGVEQREIAALNAVVVRMPPGRSAAALSRAANVVRVEPDYYATALGGPINAPYSDPLYPDQWALPAIGVPEAWASLPTDMPTVNVAVIDSGICADHPDLAGRIEAGWDFVESDAIPQDVFGHGCAVAGIIAANTNNEVGIAGIAPNAQIMPLRVLDSQGVGTYSDVAAAIIHATDYGADIINLSLGGLYPAAILEEAVNYAHAREVTVIAAAGNTGQEGVLYPAKYEPVIAVGSVDRTLERSAFSSYGPEIDFLAPGSEISSTQNDGTYGAFTGTSFAAPHVVGAYVLRLSRGLQLLSTGNIISLYNELPTPTPTATETMSIPLKPDITSSPRFEQADFSAGQFTWSPTENVLAYWQKNTLPGSPGFQNFDLIIFDTVTGHRQVLGRDGNAGPMEFSSDGQRLWFWYDSDSFEFSFASNQLISISQSEMPVSNNRQITLDSDIVLLSNISGSALSFDGAYRAFPFEGEISLEYIPNGETDLLTSNRAIEAERVSLYALTPEVGDVSGLAAIADRFDFPMCAPNFTGCKIDGSYDQSHPGHDYNGNSGGDTDRGWPVTSVANGRVVYSNYVPGNYTWGNVIMIEHTLPNSSKVWSQYAHLEGRSVSEGTDVTRGQQIGTVGKGANNQFPAHLHFEMRTQYFAAYAWQYGGNEWYRYYTNPTDYINTHRQIDGGNCPGPSLQSPSDGYVSHSRTITFSWSAPSGCTYSGYTFRIKDTPNMESGGSLVDGIDEGRGETSVTKTISSQWKNRDLYWGVRTANPLSPNWSVRRFRIEDPPAQCNTPNPGSNEVVLFKDTNYAGECKKLSVGDYANPSAMGISNDSVSSLRVGSNASVTLCQNDTFTGTCDTFTGDDSNLGNNNIGDNQASSAKVQLLPVKLYNDANYGGGWCAIVGTTAGWINVCEGYNDVASSIRIQSGWSARVWADSEKSGASRCFTSSTSNLSGIQYNENGSGSVDNTISSLAAYNQSSCPSLTSPPGAPSLASPANGAVLSRTSSLVLSWNSASGANEYQAELSGGPHTTPVLSSWSSNRTWDLGPQWAGAYQWRVRARNSAGTSGWSGYRSFTIKPGTPSNLTATASSSTQANLTWGASADESNLTGYRIYRNGSAIATVGKTVTNYTNSGLSCGTQYNYTVRAYMGSTESDASNTASITTICPATNDDFGSAARITSLPATLSQGIVGSTVAADDPDLCGRPYSNTVWYSYTPTSTLTVSVDTSGSTYDTVLGVFTGTRGALTSIICNDDSGGLQSAVQFVANAGATYYFLIADYNTTPETGIGLLVLNVSAQSSTCRPDTIGIYRARDFSWYLRNSNTAGYADAVFNYGLPSDRSITGDWDGDGYDTVGIRRGSTFYLKNSNTTGIADIAFAFGLPSDIPVAGDWNGDGIDTIGVYRPASATWYLRNSNSAGPADLTFAYGLPNETPVTGDWDGDGVDTVAIYRDSDFSWYLRNSNSAGFATIIINFGLPSDDAVTGDWNGDCVDTVGIYRPGAGNWYLKNANTTGIADLAFAYGLPNERGVTGKWLPSSGATALTTRDPDIEKSATMLPETFRGCEFVTDISMLECEALVALYHRTAGDGWTDNSGWLVAPSPCDWKGVSCFGGEHVTSVRLNDNNLTGTIPPELGDLKGLEELNLDGNALLGEIPSSLANLPIPPGRVDIGYNMLTASDAGIAAWLDVVDPDWMSTQTVSPTHVVADALSDTSIAVAWTPIAYTDDGGHYEVQYNTVSGGPYVTGCVTTDKTQNGCTVTDLVSDTVYYLVVRTFTPSHIGQSSDLLSPFSQETGATTDSTLPATSTPTDEPTAAPPQVEIPIAPLQTVESNDLVVQRQGEWTAHSTVEASGGSYLYSSGSLDDILTLRFLGEHLDIVYVQHPALGVFAVEVDGVVHQTVDTASPETAFGVWVSISGLGVGDHEARIYPVSGTIALDAFALQPQPEPTATLTATPASTTVPLVETPVPSTLTPVPTDIAPVQPTLPAVQEGLSFLEAEGARVTQIGAWTAHPTDVASGGAYLYSSGAAGESLTLAVGGGQLEIVYVQHPALGRFAVEVDGMALFEVDSYAAETVFGARAYLTLPSGDHTLRVVALDGTIALDGFAVETTPHLPSPTPQGEATSTPGVETPSATDEGVAPTPIPTSTVGMQDTPVPTSETPTVVPDLPTETPLPTATPLPLPFVDPLDHPAGWLADGAWQFVPGAGLQGSGAWWADGTLRATSSALTFATPLALPLAGQPYLSFWQRGSLPPGVLAAVEVSVDGGLSWLALDLQTALPAEWTERRLDLAAFRGAVVLLRFQTAAPLDGNASVTGGWTVDQLVVQDAPPPTSTPLPTHTATALPTDMPTSTPRPTETLAPLPTELPTPVPPATEPIIEVVPAVTQGPPAAPLDPTPTDIPAE